ncbi:hypothetical protein Gotur_002687 [Gossypium turneri]
MARDDFQLANSDLSTLQSKLDARYDEYRRVEKELKTVLERMKVGLRSQLLFLKLADLQSQLQFIYL